MKRTLATFLATSGYLLRYSNTQAAPSSIGIYPPSVKINSEPNTDVSIPITLLNNSEEEKLFQIDMLGFKKNSSSQGSIEYYTKNNMPQQLSNFLKTIKILDGENEVKSIKLYPAESKDLTVKFKTPGNTDSDYYFSPFFTSINPAESKNKDTTIQINQSIGSHILVAVGEPQKQKSYISKMNTNLLTVNGPVKIDLEIINTSPHFITITGNVSIYNFLGKKIAEKEIPSTTVLAESTKNITDSKSNNNNLEVEGSFLGLYTATSEIEINGTYKEIKQDSFIYLPFFALAVIFVVLFIVLGIAYKVIKKLNFSNNRS